MPVEPRMLFLGFGKFARADKIYALEPLRGDERGGGRRTRVWVDGIDEPTVASRTERTILHDIGQDAAAQAPIVDQALGLAERLVAAVEAGRVDLADLGPRARRLLAATTGSAGDVDFAWRAMVAVLQQKWLLDGVDRGRFPLSGPELVDRLTHQFVATVGRPVATSPSPSLSAGASDGQDPA